jgi:hypothetical protein
VEDRDPSVVAIESIMTNQYQPITDVQTTALARKEKL